MDKTKTEAPTSGVTKSASQLAKDNAKKLSEEEFDFVNLIHQHYNIHGTLFTADYGKEEYGLPVGQYNKLFGRALVKTAIEERGVPLREVHLVSDDDNNRSWRNLALTGRQIIVADTMLDLLDARSYKKKLQDLSVTSREWTAWCKEPAFARYLDENTQSVLKNGQHEAAMALMDRVSSGDVSAIKLYLEYTGRFSTKPEPKTTETKVVFQAAPPPVQLGPAPNDGVHNDAINAHHIITSLVEIIVDEVDDKATASRIADRLRALITATNITNGLLGTKPLDAKPSTPVGLVEPPQPTVLPTRELTPAMEQAVSRGAGMS
jgi:hypothetical protein